MWGRWSRVVLRCRREGVLMKSKRSEKLPRQKSTQPPERAGVATSHVVHDYLRSPKLMLNMHSSHPHQPYPFRFMVDTEHVAHFQAEHTNN